MRLNGLSTCPETDEFQLLCSVTQEVGKVAHFLYKSQWTCLVAIHWAQLQYIFQTTWWPGSFKQTRELQSLPRSQLPLLLTPSSIYSIFTEEATSCFDVALHMQQILSSTLMSTKYINIIKNLIHWNHCLPCGQELWAILMYFFRCFFVFVFTLYST